MIPLFKVSMSHTAPIKVADVLLSGFIGQGPVVDRFEAGLQSVLGTKLPPVTTNSCTSAIQLALMLLGVGPGDEVISTPITCTATNVPVVLAGAKIVWADVDPLTGNISPDDVARRITPRTKAIIAVDWSGRACDYRALRSHGVPVIQDAAHGPLTPFGGDLVCLSFGPIKHMTSGDGGALVIRADTDGELDRRARLLRWYGLDRTSTKSFRCEQRIVEVGTKLHMNDINAAIGLANLGYLEENVRRHRQNAALLDAIVDNPLVTKPAWDFHSCWWVYTLLVADRPGFQAHMERYGIETGQVHARNDFHPALSSGPQDPLAGVTFFDSKQISVPCGWWLSDGDVRHVGKAINEWKP